MVVEGSGVPPAPQAKPAATPGQGEGGKAGAKVIGAAERQALHNLAQKSCWPPAAKEKMLEALAEAQSAVKEQRSPSEAAKVARSKVASCEAKLVKASSRLEELEKKLEELKGQVQEAAATAERRKQELSDAMEEDEKAAVAAAAARPPSVEEQISA